MKIGVIGIGMVGNAVHKFFKFRKYHTIGYDKYKPKFSGTWDDVIGQDILFLCLPTQYNPEIGEYDKSAIQEVCKSLNDSNYRGIVVIKSTIEPGTCKELNKKYENLSIFHNPEFLSARTAVEDFATQNHIVIGQSSNYNERDYVRLRALFKKEFPKAKFSISSTWESEAMKIFCNCFYAVKIGFFNELYALCKKNNQQFSVIRDMMLKNTWINPMHTNVPGPDEKVGYGGACFPKDTNALNQYIKRNNTIRGILDASCKENITLRPGDPNIQAMVVSSNESNE